MTTKHFAIVCLSIFAVTQAAQAACVKTKVFECTLMVASGVVKSNSPTPGNIFVNSGKTKSGAKGRTMADAIGYYHHFPFSSDALEDLQLYIKTTSDQLVCEEGEEATCDSGKSSSAE